MLTKRITTILDLLLTPILRLSTRIWRHRPVRVRLPWVPSRVIDAATVQMAAVTPLWTYADAPIPSQPVKLPAVSIPRSPLRRDTDPLPTWKQRAWFPMTSYKAHCDEPLILVARAIAHFAGEIHWLPAEVFLSLATYEEYRATCGEPAYRKAGHTIAVRPWPGLGRDLAVCSGVA